MPNPDRDLATSLATSLTLVVGTDIFYGMVRPADGAGIPAKAIFCIATGGPKPENYLGQSKVRRFSTVQIRVRDNQDDYDGGLLFARAVRDAAHHATIAGYNEVEVQESEPNPLGLDLKGLPEWSLNVEMISEG